MRELAKGLLAGQEAWVVGGAVRDELLGRELVDLDIAVREPKAAARAYANRSGGAPFQLSDRHGAWRVALTEGRTVDFTPFPGTIEEHLASRDFTINAIAIPLAGGDPLDPYAGRGDLDAKLIRAVSPTVFPDAPLRLIRAAPPAAVVERHEARSADAPHRYGTRGRIAAVHPPLPRRGRAVGARRSRLRGCAPARGGCPGGARARARRAAAPGRRARPAPC